MYKQKSEAFHKQIRRDYLNDYFKKKRKQLQNLQQNSSEQNLQKQIKIIDETIQQDKTNIQDRIFPQNQKLSLQTLLKIYHFVKTQFGIECLKKTKIPINVLPFLTAKFYNKEQQTLATAIFANITFLKPQKLPSNQFLRSVTNILENTYDQDTIESCCLIIHNLIYQFEQAKQFYVKECQIINLLYRMFQNSNNISIFTVLLKIMSILGPYQNKQNNPKCLRKFLKFYLSIIRQTNQFQLVFLSLYNVQTLLSFYGNQPHTLHPQNSYKESSQKNSGDKQCFQILQQIQKSRMLQKFVTYYKWIPVERRYKITHLLLQVIKSVIPVINMKQGQPAVFKLLNTIYDQNFIKINPKMIGDSQINTFNNSSIKQNQLFQIQIESYDIIYILLNLYPSQHKLIIESQFFRKAYHRLQSILEDNSLYNINSRQENQMRKFFIYILGMLCYSSNLNEMNQHRLQEQIKKYHFNERNHIEQGLNIDEEDQQFENFLMNLQAHKKIMN